MDREQRETGTDTETGTETHRETGTETQRYRETGTETPERQGKRHRDRETLRKENDT